MHPVEDSICHIYGKMYSDFVTRLEEVRNVPLDSVGKAFGNVAAILDSMHYHELALAVWNRALEYAAEHGDRRTEAECRFYIGYVSNILGRFRNAITSYLAASKLFEQIGYLQGLSMCYKHIAYIYADLSEFQTADEYRRKSDEIKAGLRIHRESANTGFEKPEGVEFLGFTKPAEDGQPDVKSGCSDT